MMNEAHCCSTNYHITKLGQRDPSGRQDSHQFQYEDEHHQCKAVKKLQQAQHAIKQAKSSSPIQTGQKLSMHSNRPTARSKRHSRLGVVVVGVHIDVPQAQLMQLADDLLHGVHVLVGHSIQGACAGGGSRFLGVGEVHQPSVACAGDDLVPVGGSQEWVPAA